MDGVLKAAAVKKLLLVGRGGRCRGDEESWHLPSAVLGPEKLPEQSTTGEMTVKFRLVDLDKLENTINSMSCSCSSNEDLDSFSQYCIENDPILSEL